VKSTLRLLASVAFFLAAATLYAAQAEISGIDKIYLRSGPGAEQPAIAILGAGDPVDIIDIEGSWTKVQTPDGKVGYVYHRYVAPRVGAGSGGAVDGRQPGSESMTPPPGAAMTHPAAIAATTARGALPVRPLAAPAVAAAPAPAPVAEKLPSAELSSELATLRAEIADLKEKIQNRQAELSAEPESPPPSVPDSVAAAVGPTMTPSPAPISARDQAVGVLMIALFSLVIGWVLGSTFGRRGPRSRAGRLRF
jgi:uncharacterized protein YgiM (DUF1202 family)